MVGAKDERGTVYQMKVVTFAKCHVRVLLVCDELSFATARGWLTRGEAREDALDFVFKAFEDVLAVAITAFDKPFVGRDL